jgi:hypothetical protein
MARWLYILTAFTVLTAWAGAQNGAPLQPSLSAEDKLRLLKANSALIDNLVNDSLQLSKANSHIDRVSQCRGTSRSLVNAIQHAAEAQNAERVAVLTELFRNFVNEGLVPTIDDAKQNIPTGSPDAVKLTTLREQASSDLTDLKTAIGKNEKLNENPRVKDAVKQLDELTESLKK